MTIADNLTKVRRQIESHARAAGRDPDRITLIAASKTQSIEAITQAISAGQYHFGENYVQEALPKIQAITGMRAVRQPPSQAKDTIWHFVGAIQSNKTRELAMHFDWVHTVDRAKIARRLAEQCPSGKVLNICLQINVDEDPNKSGATPDQARALVQACRGYPQLRLRGLMTILDPQSEARQSYNRLRDCFERLESDAGGDWDTLSMGMTRDFPAAIAAGATQIRIGTAIFGPRKPRKHSGSID